MLPLNKYFGIYIYLLSIELTIAWVVFRYNITMLQMKYFWLLGKNNELHLLIKQVSEYEIKPTTLDLLLNKPVYKTMILSPLLRNDILLRRFNYLFISELLYYSCLLCLILCFVFIPLKCILLSILIKNGKNR